MPEHARTSDPIEAMVAAWPGVTSDTKWGNDRVHSVGGKMFCVTDLDGSAVSFKVEQGRFLEFTDRPGILPAPYMARAHWIQLTTPKAMRKGERDALIRRSYELVRARLTKKLQAELAD